MGVERGNWSCGDRFQRTRRVLPIDLGISRKPLIYLMEKHGIRKKTVKDEAEIESADHLRLP